MRLCIQWLLSLPIVRNAFSYISISDMGTQGLLTLPLFRHACSAPISSLLLDAELLLENATTDTETVRRMHTSVTRLRSLLQSTTQHVQESFLVYDALQEVRTVVGNAAAFSIHCDPEVRKSCRITGSKILFSECLMCIISNAIEAYDADCLKEISISITSSVQTLKIQVKDYGRGMHPVEQFLARIKGVSCNKKGSGLGFSFCVDTIHAHFSGEVLLESALGVGTIVTLTLPVLS